MNVERSGGIKEVFARWNQLSIVMDWVQGENWGVRLLSRFLR